MRSGLSSEVNAFHFLFVIDMEKPLKVLAKAVPQSHIGYISQLESRVLSLQNVNIAVTYGLLSLHEP